MTTNNAVSAALQEADRQSRRQRLLFWGAAAIEAALIASFLALADWGDRTHVLLFLSTLGVFYAIGLGVASLTFRVDDAARRILQALSLVVRERPGS